MTTGNDNPSFVRARNENLSYHKLYYSQHKLFEENSWLAKPDAGLMKLVDAHFMPAAGTERSAPLSILDLGCGVGRNAIPMAIALAKFNVPAKITCVDVLEDSIRMLRDNCTTYGASETIDAVVADNDDFDIAPGHYDLIAAISVLEHSAGRVRVLKLLKKIAAGLKPGGLVRIEFTTDRIIIDLVSKKPVPSHVETELTERHVRTMLEDAFAKFQVLALEVSPYKELLDRNGQKILWQSKQVSFSARATTNKAGNFQGK